MNEIWSMLLYAGLNIELNTDPAGTVSVKKSKSSPSSRATIEFVPGATGIAVGVPGTSDMSPLTASSQTTAAEDCEATARTIEQHSTRATRHKFIEVASTGFGWMAK